MKGNEEAGKLAKEATRNEEAQLNIPPSRTDVKVLIRHNVNKIWQADWDKEKKGRHLHNIQKEMSRSKCSYFKQTWFTHMSIGHTGLNGSLKIIHKHPTGICEFCGVREDVECVLLRCINHSRQGERVESEVNVVSKIFSLETSLGEPR